VSENREFTGDARKVREHIAEHVGTTTPLYIVCSPGRCVGKTLVARLLTEFCVLPLSLTLLTVLTLFSGDVRIRITLLPARPSRPNAISIPRVRRNVCARRKWAARAGITGAVARGTTTAAFNADPQKIGGGTVQKACDGVAGERFCGALSASCRAARFAVTDCWNAPFRFPSCAEWHPVSHTSWRICPCARQLGPLSLSPVLPQR